MAIFILKFEMSTVNFSNLFVITLGLDPDSWSGSGLLVWIRTLGLDPDSWSGYGLLVGIRAPVRDPFVWHGTITT
jgi:hypothetical protein